MQNAKSASTPFSTSTRLTDKDSPLIDKEKELNGKIPYVSVVGSIMYTMVATRPDLSYAIGVVIRYMSKPGRKHWEVVNHLFRYLKGTEDVLD